MPSLPVRNIMARSPAKGRLSFVLSFIAVMSVASSVVAAEVLQPTSISAEAFSRLSSADQRALLVRVFERRLEHAGNLQYEVDLQYRFFENANGAPGRRKEFSVHRVCRQWQLGGSYRLDSDMYLPEAASPHKWTATSYNAQEGVGRFTLRQKGLERAFGRIDSRHDNLLEDNRFCLWLNGTYPHKEDYLFRYLLDHQSEFVVKAPVDGGHVELVVGYQPWWADKSGGQRVFLLDPNKGFLPIRGDSRWDAPPSGGHDNWRIERFTVEESQLVGDVWLPVRITEQLAGSPAPDNFTVLEMTVSRLEYGRVTPADLVVPFTEDMQVVDAIKGVTYVTDSDGNPAGRIERVMGAPPPDRLKESQRLTQGSVVAIVASVVGIGILIGALLLRRRRTKVGV